MCCAALMGSLWSVPGVCSACASNLVPTSTILTYMVFVNFIHTCIFNEYPTFTEVYIILKEAARAVQISLYISLGKSIFSLNFHTPYYLLSFSPPQLCYSPPKLFFPPHQTSLRTTVGSFGVHIYLTREQSWQQASLTTGSSSSVLTTMPGQQMCCTCKNIGTPVLLGTVDRKFGDVTCDYVENIRCWNLCSVVIRRGQQIGQGSRRERRSEREEASLWLFPSVK